jgi:hypothetical protein
MGKVTITLIVFAACLLVAHLPVWYGQHLKRRNRFNDTKWKRGWEKSDYLWLALAAVGLVGATGQVRRMVAQKDLEAARLRAERQVDSAWRNIDSITQPLTMPSDSPATGRAAEGLRAAGTSAHAAWMGWEQTNGNIGYREQYTVPASLDAICGKYRTIEASIERVENAEWADACRLVRDEASQAREAVEAVKDAVLRSREGDLDAALTTFAPWILAAGLALRFAKVTAKLVGQV